MPGIDGLETARRIRACRARPGALPIVALTANVSGLDRADYVAAGMVDLVPKAGRAGDPAGSDRAACLGRARVAGPRRSHRWPRSPTPQPSARWKPWTSRGSRRGGPACRPRCATPCSPIASGSCGTCCPSCAAPSLSQDRLALKRVTHAIVGVAGNYGLTGFEACRARPRGQRSGGYGRRSRDSRLDGRDRPGRGSRAPSAEAQAA